MTYDQSEALQGLLWSYRGGWMTLRDVSALKVGQTPTRMDGEATIHRSKVAYFQVLPQ